MRLLLLSVLLPGCLMAVEEDPSFGLGGGQIMAAELPPADAGTPVDAGQPATKAEDPAQQPPEQKPPEQQPPDAGPSACEAPPPMQQVALRDAKLVASEGMNMQHLGTYPACFDTGTCDAQTLATFVTTRTHTYSALLCACKASYPTITLATAGATLTAQQEAENRRAALDCAYTKFNYTKKYWIPGVLRDADVCGLMLGAGWRLPTAGEAEQLSAADVQALTADHDFGMPDDFYHPVRLFVRAADGSVGGADFTKPSGSRVVPVPLTGTVFTCSELWGHCEGPWDLRCVRPQ